MILLDATLLLTIVSAIECQIVFPSSNPVLPQPTNRRVNGLNALNECSTKDGQAGNCYEFRSTEFKWCSFFPSLDTTNPRVAQHLRDNVCKHTGREVYFCCPNNIRAQQPTVVTDGAVDVVKTSVNSCNNPSEGCLRPAAIPFEPECGFTNSDNVVGGRTAARNAWPWLAALGRKNGARFSPFCGGTLITKQHVITAAHCFGTRINFKVTVRLGEHDVNEGNDGALDFDIVDMRVGQYNENTKENDIILLKLDRALPSYTDNIRAACLPYHLRTRNFEGNTPVVVGWGIFNNDACVDISPNCDRNAFQCYTNSYVQGVCKKTCNLCDPKPDVRRTSNVPLQAPVPVVPIAECQRGYRNSGNVVDNRQICAGRGLTDSCGGDSGGPLNYIDTTTFRFYLIGLVSFGPTNCGSQNLPGVYLRIGHYLDWIEENIKQL